MMLGEDRQLTEEEIERGIRIAAALDDADFRSWYVSRFAQRLPPSSWKRALEVARTATGFHDRLDSLLLITDKLMATGMTGEVTSLLNEIAQMEEHEDREVWPWQRADVLNRSARLFEQTGSHEEAMRTWDKAVRIAQSGQASDTDCLTVLVEIARELASSGQIVYARHVGDSIQSVGKRSFAHQQIDKLEEAGRTAQ